MRPYLKITIVKKAGEVAEVVVCLPCKHEALNLNLISTKIKKRKKRKFQS
jgi:hypothetical protein